LLQSPYPEVCCFVVKILHHMLDTMPQSVKSIHTRYEPSHFLKIVEQHQDNQNLEKLVNIFLTKLKVTAPTAQGSITS